MGWTSYYATHYKNGRVDRKAECDAQFNHDDGYVLLRSAMVGSTWYAAVRHPGGHVFGCVFLTHVHDGEFCYKDMDESMGPYAARCPVSILNLLSDTDNEHALKWREACRENARRPSPGKLPIGAKIRFLWHGEERVLVKRAPAYQFRTAWWYNETLGGYFKKTWIPADFEIIKEA